MKRLSYFLISDFSIAATGDVVFEWYHMYVFDWILKASTWSWNFVMLLVALKIFIQMPNGQSFFLHNFLCHKSFIPCPELLMKSNHLRLLSIPLLSPLIIWLVWSIAWEICFSLLVFKGCSSSRTLNLQFLELVRWSNSGIRSALNPMDKGRLPFLLRGGGPLMSEAMLHYSIAFTLSIVLSTVVAHSSICQMFLLLELRNQNCFSLCYGTSMGLRIGTSMKKIDTRARGKQKMVWEVSQQLTEWRPNYVGPSLQRTKNRAVLTTVPWLSQKATTLLGIYSVQVFSNAVRCIFKCLLLQAFILRHGIYSQVF